MKNILDAQHLIGAIVYSALGMVVFSAWFVAFDKLTPYDLWQEITVKQNRALATVLSGCAVAVGLIIAASMLG
jgi:putative membrane protein